MNLKAIQMAITQLTPTELYQFSRWLEAYLGNDCDDWDRIMDAQMVSGADIVSGKLDSQSNDDVAARKRAE